MTARRSAELRRRLPAADPAVRGQRHRPDADGQLHVAEGLRLRVPGPHCTPSRSSSRSCGCRSASSSTSSSAGAARRRVLQGSRRAGRGRALPPLRPRLRLEDARRRPDRRRARARLPLRNTRPRPRALPADLPALPPGDGRGGARRPLRRECAPPLCRGPRRRSSTPEWERGPSARKTRRISTRDASDGSMTTPGVPAAAFSEQFGPHPSHSTGPRLDAAALPDRLVKTHCCFCGQQCGIQLKVKDNQVIGFEPWRTSPSTRACSAPRA